MKVLKKLMVLGLALVMIAGMLPICEAQAAAKPGKAKITVKANSDGTSATITIAKTKNAQGYKIMVKKPGAKKFTELAMLYEVGTAQRTYTATNLTKGKYQFKVRAFLQKGSKTVWGKYSKVGKLTVSGAADSDKNDSAKTGEVKYEYDIKVWVPERDIENNLTKSMIDKFNKTNTDGIWLNATIEAVSEADAATMMITDVDAGADMFNFAQDQLSRLISAGALARLGDRAADFVRTNNVKSAIEAVSYGDDALYGYPITVDNGYYIFYDKSVVSDKDAKTVEGIIAACKKAGRTFAVPIGGNGWYLAGWFFGAGCDSTWITDDDGNFVSINDTFNSDKGLIAAKGIYKIMSSGVWVDADQASEFQAAIPCAALVSGPWNNTTIHDILGDNMGAAKMPTYTVDGKNYQIGSFSGSKIIGVKPQSDAYKAACLTKLAQYLSGEECQRKRFETLEWGPSNVNLAMSNAVRANPGLAALAAQAPFAKPQGNIHGLWWDISRELGRTIRDSDGSEKALKEALKQYEDNCKAVAMAYRDTPEAYRDTPDTFSVIGAICGTCWDTDFDMKKKGKSNGMTTYASAVLELHEGEEFKIRYGHDWDINFGVDGRDGYNFVVEQDGSYIISITINESKTKCTVDVTRK